MQDKTNDWFIKNNLTPPTHQPHLTEEEIRANMKRLMPNQWRLEGNKLIGKLPDGGELVNFIPTDYICRGTGEDGLPILEKLVL